jgi:hypothetical protein
VMKPSNLSSKQLLFFLQSTTRTINTKNPTPKF